MAGLTVPRRSVAADIATILDSPEVAGLVAELDALRFVGRRGYGSRALLGACIVKALYALPTWTRVCDLIAEHPGLSDALGGTPSHWACYRFAMKLRKERDRIADCLDALAASLREQYPDMGREVAIDASDMPAYANGQRFLYNHGPERQAYSDPDASWGHRSAVSTRKGGGFYGYKIHAAVCPRPASHSHGKSRQAAATNRSTSPRCWTLYALAASSRTPWRWIAATTTTASTTSATRAASPR